MTIKDDKQSKLAAQLPMISFFQTELKENTSLFKNNLQILQGGSFSKQTISEIEQILQAIKGAAKLLQVDCLVALSGSMEHFIKNLENTKMVLIPQHITLLQKGIDVLLAVSEIDPKKFYEYVNEQTNECAKLIEKIDKITVRHEEKPSKTDIESLEAKQRIEKEENSEIEFSRELKKYSDLLKSELVNHQGRIVKDNEIRSLITLIQEINESSKRYSITLVFQLTQILANYLEVVLKHHLQITPELMNYLLQSVELFINSCAEPENIQNWLVAHIKELQFLTDVILKETSEIMHSSSEIKDIHYDKTMLNLFNVELETQVQVLSNGLLQFERGSRNAEFIAPLMRAAHSIKGAARVVQLGAVVRLAHALEDCFVAVQNNKFSLKEEMIDVLFQSVDFLSKLSKINDATIFSWVNLQNDLINFLINNINAFSNERQTETEVKIVSPEKDIISSEMEILTNSPVQETVSTKNSDSRLATKQNSDRVLRVTAQNLNRLMGLAGEYLVESRWLSPFANSLLKLKREQSQLISYIDLLRETAEKVNIDERTEYLINTLRQFSTQTQRGFSDRITELEMFIRRYSNLADRLYREVLDSRMRPFADGIVGIPRMMRDLARQLNKKIRLEIIGENTPVDREILEKLEAPINHLLRNAIDHGIETAEERVKLGKPEEGTIYLEALHKAGMLWIIVRDDGRGIDIDDLTQKIIQRNLVTAEMAAHLSQQEILDFLFLPGFSTARKVTEISGRGVGLSVVQNLIQDVGGSFQITFDKGKGMSFQLQLPLTLSVTRSLLVQIAGEPYAFPLTRIFKVLTISRDDLEIVENRQYFKFGGQNIGIIPAYQILELDGYPNPSKYLPVVIITDHTNYYGVVVERFLGEKELVVQELDPMLGKISDVTSGAYMENGDPVLILDVEDMVRTIDKLLTSGYLKQVESNENGESIIPKKRILIVDDSITVREVECRLLLNRGYDVDTAINGVDGWNAVRIGNYDLVITDVDMPRMNGIEFVRHIKGDPRLKNTPVMIVSYKEREEDRLQGLNAGANYYLTKSSFHDESLVNAVVDLIGKP